MYAVLNDTIYKLPPVCAKVEEIETAIGKAQIGDTKTVIIDMSDVEFITAPSLIYLIALTDKLFHDAKDRVVRYHLPNEKKIRDILRIWQFPKALKEVTGRNFASLVRIEDLEYFGEPHNPEEVVYWLGRRDKGLAQLIKEKFFSITSLPFKDVFQKESSVDTEIHKWENTVILSILKSHLDNFDASKADLLPSSIIWETITNALRHGKADKLITGSYFVNNGNFFTLSYWDNGLNIYETLTHTLKQSGTIRIDAKFLQNKSEVAHFAILAKLEENGSKATYQYYYSDENPTINSETDDDNWTEKEILIASLFPGTTSDILSESYKTLPGNKQKLISEPGSGLATLLNVVIDIFNGQVAIRVGKYFMNIKRPSKSEYKAFEGTDKAVIYKKLYRIKVKEVEPSIPLFRGNMITVRLPLKQTE